jgi:hypothetical protein
MGVFDSNYRYFMTKIEKNIDFMNNANLFATN